MQYSSCGRQLIHRTCHDLLGQEIYVIGLTGQREGWKDNRFETFDAFPLSVSLRIRRMPLDVSLSSVIIMYKDESGTDGRKDFQFLSMKYRVTHLVDSNLSLTLKHIQFWPGQVRAAQANTELLF